MKSLSLIGAGEIADLAKVTRAAVSNWRRRSNSFPKSIAQLKSGPVFYRHEVIEWLKKRSGNPTNILCFLSVRDGAGKTTSILAIADKLAAEHGKRVLVIDLDPRADASAQMLGERAWERLDREDGPSVGTIFENALSGIREAACMDKPLFANIQTIDGALPIALLPATSSLSRIYDKIRVARSQDMHHLALSRIMRDAVGDALHDYDFVLLDCPNGINILMLNALAVCNKTVWVAVPNARSISGLDLILDRVDQTIKAGSRHIEHLGIMLNKRSRETPYDQDTENYLRRNSRLDIMQSSISYAKTCLNFDSYDALPQTISQKYGSGTLSREYSELCSEIVRSTQSQQVVFDVPAETIVG